MTLTTPYRVVHSYTPRQLVYQRGMARGILARDELLDDEVIVEEVPLTHHDDDERAEFVQQYRSIAVKVMRLRHANLVPVRDFWTDDESLHIVKHYDPGETLDGVLAHDATPDDDQRIALGKDILRGLAVLHDSHILHRDIKPYAIYVLRGPALRAQIDHYHLAVSAETELVSEHIVGTPLYMAPELWRDAPHRYTRQTDVYAAGLLLLELLAKRSATDILADELGERPTLPAIARCMVDRGACLDPARVAAAVPPAFAAALACALAPDPKDRFASARDLFDTFALGAPPRLARHDDPTAPDTLTSFLERLPDVSYRAEIIAAHRLAPIDARMAITKCRQIAEQLARELYRECLGDPASKPLVRLVHELNETRALTAEVFTHFYNVRRQGNVAVHGDVAPSTLAIDAVLPVIAATLRIVTWFVVERHRTPAARR